MHKLLEAILSHPELVNNANEYDVHVSTNTIGDEEIVVKKWGTTTLQSQKKSGGEKAVK